MLYGSIQTGTSADGVDIAIIDGDTNELVKFWELAFTPNEKNIIEKMLYPNNPTMAEVSKFNFEFVDIIAEKFNSINIKEKVEVFVFHGQTTFHDPNGEITGHPNTMQLGNGNYLSKKIKQNVLWDFRSGDLASGGQGAPLVQFADKELFYEGKPISIINIGGISNTTTIHGDELIAFDLGPGNALVDVIMMKYFDRPYDKDGIEASKGKLDQKLLDKFIAHDNYITKPFPKSTGKEYYNFEFIKDVVDPSTYDLNDLLNTLCAFTAYAITTHLEVIGKDTEMILAGGGAFNKTLYKYIEDMWGSEISILNHNNITPSSREAACFAVFGKYYMEDTPIGGKSTGATDQYIPGALSKYYGGNNG